MRQLLSEMRWWEEKEDVRDFLKEYSVGGRGEITAVGSNCENADI